MRNYRKEREEYRKMGKGYYHFCSDGWDGNIFNSVAQFAFGMVLIGLITILYGVKVYEFVLMPNHIHIILSGTGEEIVKAFMYLKKKLNLKLAADGYRQLPEDYGVKMIPITTPEQMRELIIYLNRNAYEKMISSPCGYPWGSSWLHYSQFPNYLRGKRACDMSKSEIESWTGKRIELPAHWEFHPVMGLLPHSFVDTHLVKELFNGPKDYFTHLIKDYEAFAKISRSVGESMEFDEFELKDIVASVLRNEYLGRPLYKLDNNEKGRLVVTLSNKFNLSAETIARELKMDTRLVSQFLRAKDYSKKS